MRCPKCYNESTKVLDSRLFGENRQSIKRRRECEKCGFRFSTIEQIEILSTKVRKRNDILETYDRKKMSKGVLKALKKESLTQKEIDNLITEIEYEIAKKVKGGEVKSKEIGEIILEKLKDIDKLSYLRFASVYRAFEDIREFEREINRIKKKQKNEHVHNFQR